MKRKISLLLAMLLLLGTLTNAAFAEDAAPASTEAAEESENANKVMNLSIEDAVKLATESDRQKWEIDDGIKKAKDSRRQGKDAKEQAEDLMSMPLEAVSAMGINITDNYVDTLLAKNNYYTKYADAQISQLEKSSEQLVKGIEIETKSLYYNVLVAEKTVEINQAKLTKADEQLRVVNLKFDNGSATKAEVLNAQLAVQEAKTDLDSAGDDLNIAKLNLLNRLDLSFDTEITLTDTELTYVPTAELDLNASIEKAKTDRPEILTAQNNLEVQEIETHVYTAYYTSNLWQNKSAVKKLEDAKLDVPQAYKDVELDVRSKYLNLVKAERALQNADKTLELAEEAARVNKLLYDNGMATSLDVLSANTDMAQAQIGRYQLLAAYNISKLTFDNSNIIGTVAAASETAAAE